MYVPEPPQLRIFSALIPRPPEIEEPDEIEEPSNDELCGMAKSKKKCKKLDFCKFKKKKGCTAA